MYLTPSRRRDRRGARPSRPPVAGARRGAAAAGASGYRPQSLAVLFGGRTRDGPWGWPAEQAAATAAAAPRRRSRGQCSCGHASRPDRGAVVAGDRADRGRALRRLLAAPFLPRSSGPGAAPAGLVRLLAGWPTHPGRHVAAAVAGQRRRGASGSALGAAAAGLARGHATRRRGGRSSDLGALLLIGADVIRPAWSGC